MFGKTPHIFKSDKHDDDFYAQMWETISQGSTWQRVISATFSETIKGAKFNNR